MFRLGESVWPLKHEFTEQNLGQNLTKDTISKLAVGNALAEPPMVGEGRMKSKAWRLRFFQRTQMRYIEKFRSILKNLRKNTLFVP